MNKSILKFGVWATVLAGLLYFFGLMSFQKWFPSKYFSGFYAVIILVYICTILFHTALIKASAKQNITFINKFVAFTGIKLLLYMFLILGYVFMVGVQPVSFLFTFLITYLVFTVFEIISILEFLKKNYSKTGSTNQ